MNLPHFRDLWDIDLGKIGVGLVRFYGGVTVIWFALQSWVGDGVWWLITTTRGPGAPARSSS